MKSFDYVRAGHGRRGGRRSGAARRRLSRRRHQSARPDEGRRRCGPTVSSTSRDLPGLDRIERLADGGVRIGALARNADLAHDADFAGAYPAVAEALLSGASAQLRNAATVGGNLLQRTRCATSTTRPAPATSANRAPAATRCSGENRLHAVLGWSEHCIATHPSDFCVPLVALDAIVEIEGKDGRREIALEDLHRLPGDRAGARKRARAGGPDRRASSARRGGALCGHARYLKLRERTSFAFAVVSAAAALDLDGGIDREARARPGRCRGEAMARARGRSRRWPAHMPMRQRSAERPKRRWPTRSPPATTHSRSNSRAGSLCARSRSPRPERPSACLPFPLLPSPPFPRVLHHA